MRIAKIRFAYLTSPEPSWSAEEERGLALMYYLGILFQCSDVSTSAELFNHNHGQPLIDSIARLGP